MVFIRDPSVKRHARAEEPNTTVLAVGGPRDAAYEPSPWEHSFAAERHRASGDYEAMATEIAKGLEQHPDNPGLLYNLGCAEALAGRPDDALEHVRRALELRPEWEDMADKDEDLVTVRELPGWPLPRDAPGSGFTLTPSWAVVSQPLQSQDTRRRGQAEA